MAHKIIPVFEKFEPNFTESELNSLNLLRSQFGNGPFDKENLYFFGFRARDSIEESIRSLVRKGIISFSPDYKSFNFTDDGWDAYIEIFKAQKEWESGKRNLDIVDKPIFKIDGRNKILLAKAYASIFDLAKKFILIQDAYMEAVFIYTLGDINDAINIKILTAEKGANKARHIATRGAIRLLLDSRNNTEVKLNNNFHPRKIIIDGEWAWIIDGSQGTKDMLTFSKMPHAETETREFREIWSKSSDFKF